MQTTTVFSRNLKAYVENEPLVINQGGTSSTKTYSILQLLLQIAERSNKKLIISVVSYALPHLKLGAMRDFEDILTDAGYNIDKIKNKTELYFRIGKSIIEFFSADNLAKVHGPRRDILYLNECNNMKYKVYDQLSIRTRKTIFLDYNPTNQFWVHDEVIPSEPHTFIKSTYLDNPFLSASTIQRIESRKKNENWWRVYGLGETGQLEGAILKNWRWGSPGEVDEFINLVPYGYGLDFGVKDPDAFIKVGVDRKNERLYWKEEFYKIGNSTDDLAYLIDQANVSKRKLIIADSQGLRTIKDLRSRGFNVKSAIKGKITDDVKELLKWEIIVHEESYNLGKELNAWVWLDKRGEVPLDDFNHLIDAGRYYSMHVIKPRTTKGHKAL